MQLQYLGRYHLKVSRRVGSLVMFRHKRMSSSYFVLCLILGLNGPTNAVIMSLVYAAVMSILYPQGWVQTAG